MKKYSLEWKEKNKKGWAQYHPSEKCWKIHYIQNDTEYSYGNFTKADAQRVAKGE